MFHLLGRECATRELAGATEVYATDGGELTDAEWEEYARQLNELRITRARMRRAATLTDRGQRHGNDPASIFATDETDQAEARNAKTVCIR